MKIQCEFGDAIRELQISKLLKQANIRGKSGKSFFDVFQFSYQAFSPDRWIIVRLQVWFQCSDKIMNHRSGGRFAGCSSGINLFQHLCIPDRIIHIRPENIKHICHSAKASAPPLIIILPMVFPIINRNAPKLTVFRKTVDYTVFIAVTYKERVPLAVLHIRKR